MAGRRSTHIEDQTPAEIMRSLEMARLQKEFEHKLGLLEQQRKQQDSWQLTSPHLAHTTIDPSSEEALQNLARGLGLISYRDTAPPQRLGPPQKNVMDWTDIEKAAPNKTARNLDDYFFDRDLKHVPVSVMNMELSNQLMDPGLWGTGAKAIATRMNLKGTSPDTITGGAGVDTLLGGINVRTKTGTAPNVSTAPDGQAAADSFKSGAAGVVDKIREAFGTSPDGQAGHGSKGARSTHKQRDFFREHMAYAKAAGLTGVQAELAVTQAAQETGWGTVGQAVKGNNFHGMKKGSGWTGKTVNLPTKEQTKKGANYTVNADFRQYDSPVDSYRDWKKQMEEKWPGVMKATTFDDAVEALNHGVKGKYSTSLDYADKLKEREAQLQASGVFGEGSVDVHARHLSGGLAGIAQGGQVVANTKAAISTLHPAFRDLAQSFMDKAAAAGLHLGILKDTGGYRTSAEQARIKATGVQAASPTNSFHNYGLGFDYVVMDPDTGKPKMMKDPKTGKMVFDKTSPEWAKARTLAEGMGLFQPYADQGDLGHVNAIPGARVPDSIKKAAQFTDANGISYPELPADVLEAYARPHTQLASTMAGTGILGVGGALADPVSLVAGSEMRPAPELAAPVGTVERAPLSKIADMLHPTSTAERVAPEKPGSATTPSLADMLNPVSAAYAAPGPAAERSPAIAALEHLVGKDVTPQSTFPARPEAPTARPSTQRVSPSSDISVVSPTSTPEKMTPQQYSAFSAMLPEHLAPLADPAETVQPDNQPLSINSMVAPQQPEVTTETASPLTAETALAGPKPTSLSPIADYETLTGIDVTPKEATIGPKKAPLARPVVVQPRPVAPVQVAAAAPPAAPAPPSLSVKDIYDGKLGQATDSAGNVISRDAYGRTAVTNKFGATTVTLPDGRQAASNQKGPLTKSTISNPIDGLIDSINSNTDDKNPAHQMDRHQLGGLLLGAIAGGLVGGPAGAMGGMSLGRRVTRPSFLDTPLGRLFAGDFPSAPPAKEGSITGSNLSHDQMRGISPDVTRDIEHGKAGLF